MPDTQITNGNSIFEAQRKATYSDRCYTQRGAYENRNGRTPAVLSKLQDREKKNRWDDRNSRSPKRHRHRQEQCGGHDSSRAPISFAIAYRDEKPHQSGEWQITQDLGGCLRNGHQRTNEQRDSQFQEGIFASREITACTENECGRKGQHYEAEHE
ncbi:MAG: hypothetical protein JRE43_04725 [Deltaproteobacteria bacterium]|nr:hypothetical protein [Deltaproteobacteria bacterium]